MSRQAVNPQRIVTAVLTFPLFPQPVLLALVRPAVAALRQRFRQQDRRQAEAAERLAFPAEHVYCIDGYHGGITFWDWLALPKGGFWYAYCWGLIGRLLLERASGSPPLHVVFDVDAHTCEHMARRHPEAIAQLRQAVQAGAIEVVNGTYGQPLAQTVSGEAIVRHFYHGLAAIEKTLGVRVDSFLSQEPLFFPQLPQLLAGFSFRRAVFRTHWAAFGSDPAEDAAIVRWQGPDGSEMPTVPRYRFMDYDHLRPEDHPGLTHGGLTGADLRRWGQPEVEAFRRQAEEHGIARPLVSRVADFHIVDPTHPDAPLPNAVSLAGQGLRFVTVKEYFSATPDDGPTVSHGLDDIPATIPWGLGGEELQKAQSLAEGNLLAAERLDALAHALGKPSEEKKLARAWKLLLRAQHHDLYVCGPWLSRRHGGPMAAVGIDLAAASKQAADAVAQRALAYLASAVDTSRASGQPLLVFNPSPWPRQEYIEAARTVVDLPPLGYRTIDTEAANERRQPERSSCSVEMHPDGTLSLVVDGQRLLEGGYLTVWKDGRWHDSRQSVTSARLVEEETVCHRYLVEGTLASFPFRQWLTVYEALPRIDFRLEVDFGSGAHLGPQLAEHDPAAPYYLDDARKLCVNFLSPLRRTFCLSPFLLAESQSERIIGLAFLGLGDGNGKGLAFLNRGTPGYHFHRQTGLLRNVLAWAPREWLYASDDSLTSGRSRYTALRGRHVYEYAIVPCASRLEALRAGMDYQLPLVIQPLPRQAGSLPPTASFLHLEPESVVLSALFVQKEKTYARLWNALPRAGQASIRSGSDRLSLWAASLDLREESPIETVTLRPWGIQTVRLESLGVLPSE
ncbi:MAG: hypothetical protein ACUVV3_07100 [Dehalococcoidia bacterium]